MILNEAMRNFEHRDFYADRIRGDGWQGWNFRKVLVIFFGLACRAIQFKCNLSRVVSDWDGKDLLHDDLMFTELEFVNSGFER